VSEKPRKLALVIHSLDGGGAERVVAMMANQWAAQGDRVTVITLDTVESDRYPVDPGVRRIGLGLMGLSRHPWQAVVNNRRRVRSLRAAIGDAAPQCVVSATDQMNVLTLLAARPLRLPVIIAEHNDPRHQYMGHVWEWLRRRTYPRCAAAVALTPPVADHLRPLVAPAPVHVIPNPAHPPRLTVSDAVLRQGRSLAALGRLARQKGFDLLLDAFAPVAARHPDWRLEIAGEGPERGALQNRIDRYGLGSRVRLVGWAEEPDRFLSQSAIFVMSSRYEGFPVALIEAMACGLPVVSFDCDSGPREIIRPDHDGLLVPAEDVAGLQEAIERMIGDATLRVRLGANARSVVTRFSPELFLERWNQVLESTVP
jgi:GalNAc-alpha-(1->4)-GalNAc-alpha-(1->3)-diNAcBac-PP-undecaprenol alpha-1,4-N-acetyl-D-galactosaminyltransferase